MRRGPAERRSSAGSGELTTGSPGAGSSPIDAELARLPGDQQRALQALRQTIAAAAPETVEAMSYGAPAETDDRWG